MKKLMRLWSTLVTFCFVFTSVFTQTAFAAQSPLSLPVINALSPLSQPKPCAILRGLKIDPKNPLKFEFIIDQTKGQKIDKEEFRRLVGYFMAALTVPQEDFWVNLSPYEKERVIPQQLSDTDFGRDLLVQDYVLKQVAASLTHPETALGKKYWNAINDAGMNSHSSVNNFNKIWIMPDKIDVFENNNLAIVGSAKLKVLTEEDYLATQKNNAVTSSRLPSANIFKAQILPVLTKEVNEGANFSSLRQMYYSFALALWFKQKVKESFYKYYINQNKTAGITLDDKTIKERVYAKYVEAFQKGAYDYIKKEFVEAKSPVQKITKRVYFSGGVDMLGGAVAYRVAHLSPAILKRLREAGVLGMSMIAGSVLLANGCGGLGARPDGDAEHDGADNGDVIGEVYNISDGGTHDSMLPPDGRFLDLATGRDVSAADKAAGPEVALIYGTPPDATVPVDAAAVDTNQGLVDGSSGPFHPLGDASTQANPPNLPDASPGLPPDAPNQSPDVPGPVDVPPDSFNPASVALPAPLDSGGTSDVGNNEGNGDSGSAGGKPRVLPATIDTITGATTSESIIKQTFGATASGSTTVLIPTSYWQSVTLDGLVNSSQQVLIAGFPEFPQLISDLLNSGVLQGANAHEVGALFLSLGNEQIARDAWANPNQVNPDTSVNSNGLTNQQVYDNAKAYDAGLWNSVYGQVKAAISPLAGTSSVDWGAIGVDGGVIDVDGGVIGVDSGAAASGTQDLYVRIVTRLILYNHVTISAFQAANPVLFAPGATEADFEVALAKAMIYGASSGQNADALYSDAAGLLSNVGIYDNATVNNPFNIAAVAIGALGIPTDTEEGQAQRQQVAIDLEAAGGEFMANIKSTATGIDPAVCPAVATAVTDTSTPSLFMIGMGLLRDFLWEAGFTGSGGTIGRWEYDRIEINIRKGTLTLVNARRIPNKDTAIGKNGVEEEFLIDGQNKARDIVLNIRKLSSDEEQRILAVSHRVGLSANGPMYAIVHNRASGFHRIGGLGAMANNTPIKFFREDLLERANDEQLTELVDHENREANAARVGKTSSDVHDEARDGQYSGGLTALIKDAFAGDKKKYGGISLANAKIDIHLGAPVHFEVSPKVVENFKNTKSYGFEILSLGTPFTLR